MAKPWKGLALLAAAALFAGPPPAWPGVKNFRPHGDLTGERTFGEYTVRTYRALDGNGSWEILRGGTRVRAEHGICFWVGGTPDRYDDFPAELAGKDMTGDGKPDLALCEWTGGAHCDFIARVFELQGKCRLLAEVNGVHSMPTFKDLDGDGVPEILLRDSTYAYWPGCFAYSPAPKVVLRWNKRKYAPDAALMAKPRPSEAELRDKAEAIRQDSRWLDGPFGRYSQWYIPPDLFRTALDLMYTGHEEAGWTFIRAAWTPEFPIDEDVLAQLRKKMAASPYWKEVKRQRSSRKGAGRAPSASTAR